MGPTRQACFGSPFGTQRSNPDVGTVPHLRWRTTAIFNVEPYAQGRTSPHSGPTREIGQVTVERFCALERKADVQPHSRSGSPARFLAFVLLYEPSAFGEPLLASVWLCREPQVLEEAVCPD